MAEYGDITTEFWSEHMPARVESDCAHGKCDIWIGDKEAADYARRLAGHLWAAAESADNTGCELVLLLPNGTKYEPEESTTHGVKS